ncbi:PREDICTED: solute carrier family 35 member G1-like [Branchiostoma belcheri]|uniref:Solute carrier family 35 member G1-like n=1 Tax=Branchiostoma belcheri TaxID=7741 RepID=A0A6P4YXB4_BRABE|nr:PREDICTED: solute carrier family 35 member G1-like [Branchiostoma belcheri]
MTGNSATATYIEETTNREGAGFAQTCLTPGAGVLYALLHTVLAATASQFMALGSQVGIPGLQLIFLMKCGETLAALLFLPFFRPKLTTENGRQTLLLVLSTITENAGSVLQFMSFVFVVPGIAFGIIKGSLPLATACIGFLFLKETVGVVDCFGIVLNVAGVVLVAYGLIIENTSSTQRLTASILLPLAATFGRAPSLVISRSLIGVQKVSVLTVLFYANMTGAVVLLGLTYLFETPIWAMSAQTVGNVVGLCLCGCGAQFATNLSLKTEKAGITATIRTFTIPLAVLLDYILLSELPSPLKSGGVVLIMFGTGVVAVYTWWRHRKETLHKNLMQSLDFDK